MLGQLGDVSYTILELGHTSFLILENELGELGGVSFRFLNWVTRASECQKLVG